MKPAVSNAEKSQIERLFGAPVRSAEFLMSGRKGLSIVFASEAGVPGVNKSELCRLSHRYGFLRLRHVFWDVSPTDHITASNYITRDGTLEQDPFHRDGQQEGEPETYTELSNQYIPRKAPTFYAHTKAVRRAIGQLSREGHSPEVVQALDAMGKPNYPFVFFGEETARVRSVLQEQFPDFTQQVFDLIPDTDKFQQEWRSGGSDVIIQGNAARAGVLHARPAGPDKWQPLLSNRITP